MKVFWLLLALVIATSASADNVSPQNGTTSPTGDRVAVQNELRDIKSTAAASTPIGEGYLLAPGDVLNVVVKGRIDLGYHVNQTRVEGTSTANSPDQITVNPAGLIVIPIAGSINAAGKTVAQVAESIKKALAEYFKNFDVSVNLATPRTMKVFINGSVGNPGAQALPGTATLLEAVLAAGINQEGSTRRIELRRNGSTETVDIYSVATRGQLDKNPTLEPGDTIYVPTVTQWVDISGEITRPGRYELLPGMKIKDIVELAMGPTPVAMDSKTLISRPNADGNMETVRVDATKACSTPDSSDNISLVNGDRIRIPSLGEYMPLIRMVGEFVGRGVYQRTLGSDTDLVLNKSGVFQLAKGKTAGEVIRETGGVTPQADLKHARIQRVADGKKEEITLDLEKLLTQNDASADVTLNNGDTVILPALPDKVYVFGAVARPGAFAYTPGRKLADYIGDAGGQTKNGRLSHVRLIRGDSKNPVIKTCDVTKGIRDGDGNNPNLEPGDTVFVADRDFAGWRDVISVFTTIRLIQSIAN